MSEETNATPEEVIDTATTQHTSCNTNATHDQCAFYKGYTWASLASIAVVTIVCIIKR